MAVQQNMFSRTSQREVAMAPLLSRATHKTVIQNMFSRAESRSVVYTNLLSRARSIAEDVAENLMQLEDE